MKTEKIRNLQKAVSDGGQITGHTQSEDGDLQGQQILIVGGEGLLWERVSASTAPTTSSDPETLARKYMTSPQKLQRTGQLLSEGITQNPINYASCSQVTPGSHLPESLILCYRPCPTVCPRTWCVLFISCFHILRMQPTSLHCWVAAP